MPKAHNEKKTNFSRIVGIVMKMPLGVVTSLFSHVMFGSLFLASFKMYLFESVVREREETKSLLPSFGSLPT